VDFAKQDRLLRGLKGKDRPYERPLGDGLSVRVTANSARTLYLRVKINRKAQRINLGAYPAVTLKDAYDKSLALRAEIKQGRDPRLEGRRAKFGTNTPTTVAEAIERYVTEHARVKQRTEWAKESERLLRIEVLPKIGSYPLVQLNRSDLANLIARKAEAVRKAGYSGIVANRLSAVVSRFIRFCADYGWLDASLGLRLPKPATERSRDRNLSVRDLALVWSGLLNVRAGQGSCLPVYGKVLSLLMLTGWRVTEITRLTPSRIDRNERSIVLIEAKNKASQRKVLLPPLAWSVLDTELTNRTEIDDTDLIFQLPKGGEIPENEVSRATRKVVTALGMVPWTPRDLRRSVVSLMAELGIDGDVRRRITGHVATDIHGRVYDRSQRLHDGLDALRRVEAAILAEVSKQSASDHANVIPIAKR
jgi:integrase